MTTTPTSPVISTVRDLQTALQCGGNTTEADSFMPLKRVYFTNLPNASVRHLRFPNRVVVGPRQRFVVAFSHSAAGVVLEDSLGELAILATKQLADWFSDELKSRNSDLESYGLYSSKMEPYTNKLLRCNPEKPIGFWDPVRRMVVDTEAYLEAAAEDGPGVYNLEITVPQDVVDGIVDLGRGRIRSLLGL